MLADRTALGLAAAFAEDGAVELPEPEDAVARFHEALLAEPARLADLDPAQADLLVALKLRR